jgi:hypothetical protein
MGGNNIRREEKGNQRWRKTKVYMIPENTGSRVETRRIEAPTQGEPTKGKTCKIGKQGQGEKKRG